MTLPRIISSAALAASIISAGAAGGDWTYHPSFSGIPYRIFDTPTKIYFLSRPQEYQPRFEDTKRSLAHLYSFEPETEELRFLGRNAGLDSDLVTLADYNPAGGYLLVVYENYIIDMLHDNGDRTTITGLAAANNVALKNVNSISFDPAHHRAYLATDFGYLAINDERGEIAESYIFGRKLSDVARAGNHMVAADEEGNVYIAPADRAVLQWEDFTPLGNADMATRLLPVSDTTVHYTCFNKGTHLYTIDLSGAQPTVAYNRYLATEPYITLSNDGFLISGGPRISLLNADGFRNITIRDEEKNVAATSLDLRKFYFSPSGEGFYTLLADEKDGETQWTQLRGTVRPEGPEPFQATYIKWLPPYGFLIPNHGLDKNFSAVNPQTPLQLSALKDGSWTQYGFKARNPQQLPAFSHPDGLAVDPDNPSVLYFGSRYSGIMRINLEDPEDVLHMSRVDDAWSALPGFVEVHSVLPHWERLSSFVAPQFDAQGNMWTVYNKYRDPKKGEGPAEMEIWVWPAENRRASRNAASFKPFLQLDGNDLKSSSSSVILPLKYSSNAGLVVAIDNQYHGSLLVLDHQGTLSNPSDDKKAVLSIGSLVDIEGQKVSADYATTIYEDPQTGLVWVGTDQGLFCFNPRTALQDSPRIQQFKVARNDGTSLADYLLAGVRINNITSDARNRKWISTHGAGLVCVSSDGREVITSQTTSNSDIPSNEVFAVEISPDTGNMMVATSNGLSEYRPYSAGDGTDFESARAYPNPVRPEYLGYVTIDGLVDGAIVKIIDAKGRLVKELGFAANGEVKWDVADMNQRRVPSGVYFVLASTSPDSDALAKATKILVVN